MMERKGRDEIKFQISQADRVSFPTTFPPYNLQKNAYSIQSSRLSTSYPVHQSQGIRSSHLLPFYNRDRKRQRTGRGFQLSFPPSLLPSELTSFFVSVSCFPVRTPSLPCSRSQTLCCQRIRLFFRQRGRQARSSRETTTSFGSLRGSLRRQRSLPRQSRSGGRTGWRREDGWVAQQVLGRRSSFLARQRRSARALLFSPSLPFQ